VLDLPAFPILEGHKVSRVLLLISDITEKMALQAEAMQAGHMASLGEHPGDYRLSGWPQNNQR
jgi:two-component system, NtrC family, sensor kinase